MNRANLKYAAIFAVFMLLIVFMYIGTNTLYDEEVISAQDRSIWNRFGRLHSGAQSILDKVGIVQTIDSSSIDGCESDFVGEYTDRRMDEYLKHRRECLLKYCGDVCKTTAESGGDDIQKDVDDKSNAKVGELKSGNYAKLQLKQKHFDCKLLFESKVHDLPAPSFMSKPFKDIPDLLKADYLYDRRIQKNEWYIEENFPTNRTSKVSSKEDYRWYRNDQWTKKSFDQKIKAVKSKDWDRVGGAYGGLDTRVLHDTIDLYKDRVVGKRALVIGSETPWVESILLALGAEHVTTLEYNRIVSTHPQHEAILPSELSERFVSNGYRSVFDIVVSYSSIEHSGLTRYGDAPHPWGDLVTMARNWCFTDDAGMAFIGIPTDTTDSIYFNAHRFYGSLMLSHLFTNWKLKFASWPFKVGGGRQVTFVLEKNANL